MSGAAIPFHVPYLSGKEQGYVQDTISRGTFSGGGYYTQLCEAELVRLTQSPKVLLTSSCTHALEMCALLLDVKPGDEVIMSAFNFVSAANAFVLRGAKIVFVDIDPATMNIDPNCIEGAITPKTKAILAMHYGGVACDMDAIMAIAQRHNLKVVEDAAHCIDAYYKGRHLGTIGDLGTLSFHATKNIHCGEGGALLVNDPAYHERAEIIREKGTNRTQFIQGQVDKYTWVDVGSSYLMSELSAAFLWGQLGALAAVTAQRRSHWDAYYNQLSGLEGLMLAEIPSDCQPNGHLFYVKWANSALKEAFVVFAQQRGVPCYFHYLPLYTSVAGRNFGRFVGEDAVTSRGSNCLLRLPLFMDLQSWQSDTIYQTISSFYANH